MVSIKNLFSNVANVLSFVLLQLLASEIFGQNCFVYIGAIIFLDWNRNNCIWHMISAFLVGILFDVAYHTLGVHTFALVLLAYIKYYILILFVPGYSRERVDLTIRSFGISKIILYVLVCTLVFYITLFVLSFCKNITFTTGLVRNYFLCSSILFLCQIVMMFIDLIFDAK